MNTHPRRKACGFTLLETVIAIAVLSVLLTGFVAVFSPAAAGVRRAIDIQDADRLASALEQELTTVRQDDKSGNIVTGFDKAFTWLQNAEQANTALLLYRYRGSTTSLRSDGTPEPVKLTNQKLPGQDYVIQTVLRKRSDATKLREELAALEGSIYVIRATQWIQDGTAASLKPGTPGQIQDPEGGQVTSSPEQYPAASIAFAADFHALPSKSYSYLETNFQKWFSKTKNQKPVFSRNLAVRR
jgi:prepilin-type N-terminal cleavage/methylation domain-containing protein